MRSLRTSGSVGRAPGNRCLYPESDRQQPLLVPRSGFQWQGKRNVFSRKEEKGSGSNKYLSHKTPDF